MFDGFEYDRRDFIEEHKRNVEKAAQAEKEKSKTVLEYLKQKTRAHVPKSLQTKRLPSILDSMDQEDFKTLQQKRQEIIKQNTDVVNANKDNVSFNGKRPSPLLTQQRSPLPIVSAGRKSIFQAINSPRPPVGTPLVNVSDPQDPSLRVPNSHQEVFNGLNQIHHQDYAEEL